MRGPAVIAVAVLAVAIGLASCGDGEEVATTSSPTTTTTTAEPDRLRRDFEDQIRAVLERGGEASRVDVDCVVERLRETLPNEAVASAVEAAGEGDEIPQGAVDAAFEAGRDCAAAG